MLLPYYKIIIQQVTPYYYTNTNGVSNRIERNRTLILDFVAEFKIEKSWEKHTDTATLKLPKNIILETDEYFFKETGVFNVILGGVVNDSEDGTPIRLAPLFLRGDMIEITCGYRYKNEVGESTFETNSLFKGYISKINSTIPIEIECEDNFYLLKKTPIGLTRFPKDPNDKNGTLYDLVKWIVKQTNNTISQMSSLYPKLDYFKNIDSITNRFSLGYLDIDYETMSCSMVLNHLRTKYGFESYFIEDILYFGFPLNTDSDYKSDVNSVYETNRAKSYGFFDFENNIIDSNLEYKNKEDIELSTIVKCQTVTNGGQTLDGATKTKREVKKVYVFWNKIKDGGSWDYIDLQNNKDIPANEGGERHECIFPVGLNFKPPTVKNMFNLGISQLKKYYYTGFSGSFKTFIYPFVQWNDNVNIISNQFADRNGQYKVKKVIYTAIDGLSQEIFLDYKQQVKVPDFTEIYLI